MKLSQFAGTKNVNSFLSSNEYVYAEDTLLHAHVKNFRSTDVFFCDFDENGKFYWQVNGEPWKHYEELYDNEEECLLAMYEHKLKQLQYNRTEAMKKVDEWDRQINDVKEAMNEITQKSSYNEWTEQNEKDTW